MKLHNTRTRQTDTFAPLQSGQARIYSCGPTVYDHVHIGNLSAFIAADTLRRVVRAQGYETTHAMNYTDVDDKTIRRSRERYADEEPMAALRKLTDEYIAVFHDDMRAVGNDLAAITFLRATDPAIMDGMQGLITQLHAAGFAYIADDGVYFSIAAYRKSGKVYGQLLELTTASTSEARIDNDEYDKESVHDFALWKKQKPGEPAWPFTLDGQDLHGRPGWHIECSVMSRRALGQPFDIHTGGVDLIFPHHENEIAQSTALTADPLLATFFVHNEHIQVDGKKMSKSLKNFYTLADIQKKGYDPLAFRLLVLQSHYRSQAQFSWETLAAAQQRLTHMRETAVLVHQPAAAVHSVTSSDFVASLQRIREQLDDDLNTAGALAELSMLFDTVAARGITRVEQSAFGDYLRTIDALLGLQLSMVPDITDAQKQLIAAREVARADKDWQQSDALRDQLATGGIGVRDTSSGSVWYPLPSAN